MRELALVGLSDDKRHLLAHDRSTGEEVLVHANGRFGAVIEAVSDALQGSSPGDSFLDRHTSQRLSQQRFHTNTAQTQPPREAAMESSLTPREIQTRIRRGEDPDDVAGVAGVPRETIEGYVIPVLAEREHVCEKARDTIIRRRHVGGPGVKLGDLVDDAVRARGGHQEHVAWDSWRDDDGRWTLVVDTGHDTATFTYDAQDRYVLPADQHSRDLVGDIAGPDSADTALADAVDSATVDSVPPEAAQSGWPHDQHPDAGYSATGSLATGSSATGFPDDGQPDTILTRAQPSIGAGEETSDEDTPPGVSSLRAARERRAMEQMEQLALSDEWTDQSHEPRAGTRQTQEASSPVGNDAHDPCTSAGDASAAVPDDPPASRQPPKRRQERRRVPSWDEIMFGETSD